MENSGDSGGDGRAGPVSPEEEIEKLRAEIAFLNKKLQIVGSITRHDVLNQMTAIVGYNELLGMVITDENQKAYLDREKVAVDKIRRLFMFSKDYQSLATEPPRWQNLDNALRRAIETLDNPAIRIQVPGGTTALFADNHLDKVFFQIFDNTVRHGGKATEIRVTFRREGPGALLVIEDNGTGIPAADKGRIFERGFGRATGWGLFLAREILAITGITIAETGEPGNGARFVITLPPGTHRECNGE